MEEQSRRSNIQGNNDDTMINGVVSIWEQPTGIKEALDYCIQTILHLSQVKMTNNKSCLKCKKKI